MKSFGKKCIQTGALLFALAGTSTLFAQVTCNTSAGVPPIIRSTGLTEQVGDIILVCTGGAPTPSGQVVPQVNITVTLNTAATSHVLANLPTNNPTTSFDEALLLIDEPNTISNGVQHPLFNCGNTGAKDNGVSGPGVCSIVSTGNPAQTYNGQVYCPGVYIAVLTCPHPNAFQGRLGVTNEPPVQNVIEFLGVPFDPPGAGTRTLRITNLRANAYLLTGGQSNPPQVLATVAINGSQNIQVAPAQQTVAFVESGITAEASPIPGLAVRIMEGFSSAFQHRNIAFTVGNPTGTQANGVFTATPSPQWHYTGYPNGAGSTAFYPTQAAQNVPGAFYHSEDGFQWQPGASFNPPTPNPPLTFGTAPVSNLGEALNSVYSSTGISGAGVSSQGTRIAFKFSGVPSNMKVQCTDMVELAQPGSVPTVTTGTMFMTPTDASGAGVYPVINPLNHLWDTSYSNYLVVYEILYSDPFEIEYADIPCRVYGPGAASSYNLAVTVSLAPFYSTALAGEPSPTPTNSTPTAIPRFFLPNSDEHPTPPIPITIPGVNQPVNTIPGIN